MRRAKLTPLYSGSLAVLLGIAVMLPAIVKFGGFFAIRGDYVNQSITHLITSKLMLTGKGVPLWNWKNFLGTAYTGALSTLFSPDAICMLFPVKLMPYAATLLMLLRWFIMGVTSSLFIRRFVKKPVNVIIGSLIYCFSGYAVAALEFSAFYNTIAFFPLLLLAVEQRFADADYKYTMIPAAALNLLASVYMFIGSSIALLIYAVIRYFTAEEWRENKRFSMILFCILEYLLGVLFCGPKLLSFILSMLSSSRAGALIGGGSTGSWIINHLIPDHLFDAASGIFLPAASNRVSTFFKNTNWYSMQAYLPVFGFSMCFASLIRKKLKDSLNIILVSMLVFSVIPLFNGAASFYGNGYTRWWYALTLVTSVITMRAFEETEFESGSGVRCGVVFQWTAILVIPAVFLLAEVLSNSDNGFINSIISVFFLHDYTFGFAEDVFRIFSIAFGVLFAAVLTVLALSRGARRYALPIIMICIAVYGAAFVALNNSDAEIFKALFNDPKTDKEYKDLSLIVDKYYKDDKILGGEPYEYRVDFPYLLVNYAPVIDQPSLSSFESTVDSDAAGFAEFADMGTIDGVHFFPNDDSNELRTLLSAKYYYNYFPDDESIAVPEGFDFVHNEKGVDVYENRYFIPFGFAYDDYITQSELESQDGADAALLLHTLVVSDEDAEFVSRIVPHCSELTSNLAEDVTARRRCTSAGFLGNAEGFTAEFELPSEEVVFFSVPYDEGWRASVDGENCRIIMANVGFMAIVIPEGRHSVVFSYHNPALAYGAALTAAGIFAAAGYVCASRTIRKYRAMKQYNTIGY